ncbi:hypothetical protein Y1Q_0020208 [Alligator mississippiensis]|uniref:Uncharacterized protein n=1 Tax=Alligator mississippiensis TaxID=8496 RepID=A0A151PIH6_ALLMI|nr:hypothetical protein Y1Q_0020208 [Alligator mississippiensis]
MGRGDKLPTGPGGRDPRFLVSPICLEDVWNPRLCSSAFSGCGSASAAPLAQRGLVPAPLIFYPMSPQPHFTLTIMRPGEMFTTGSTFSGSLTANPEGALTAKMTSSVTCGSIANS